MTRLLKVSICLVLVAVLCGTCESKDNKINKAIKAMGNLPGILGEAFGVLDTLGEVMKIFTPPAYGELDEAGQLQALSDGIDSIASNIRAFESRITGEVRHLSSWGLLQGSLKHLFKYINSIDEHYSTFVNYVNETLVFRDEKKKKFATDMENSHVGVSATLKKMHESFIGEHVTVQNIPRLIQESEIAQKFMCKLRQSNQQIIYNIYQKMLAAEVKGYAILLFSSRISNTVSSVEEKTSDDQAILNAFRTRMNGTFEVIQHTMSAAPRDLWRCDPYGGAVEGFHYARVGPVFQRFIIFEKEVTEVNQNSNYEHCSGSCAAFKHVEHYCPEGKCGAQRCLGNVRNCEHKGQELFACASNDPYRRYQYMKIDDHVFGHNHTCDFKETNIGSEYSYGIFWSCSYCICTCEDNRQTIDKYFSLRPVFSDVEANKVITGVRFRLERHIFYIQIKQGVLLPNGRIDPDTNRWKEIKQFNTYDWNVKAGRDYHEIQWNQKEVFLDNLDSSASPYDSKEYVLTGLKFESRDEHIQLAVFYSRFDFATGKIIGNERSARMFMNEADTFERSELPMEELDVPIVAAENNHVRSGDNQYFEFVTSNLEKDAGQNVLPFIDIQSVETIPPTPLSGAGLFVRADNRDESGGYLSLKLFTYNFADHMRVSEADEHRGKMETLFE